MEHTTDGEVEGYTHFQHRVKLTGEELERGSREYFELLLTRIEGKDVVWRKAPHVIKTPEGYTITARLNIKD